jgi:hypothetical protein
MLRVLDMVDGGVAITDEYLSVVVSDERMLVCRRAGCVKMKNLEGKGIP